MKKIAAILILALTLSACTDHREISEPVPTETAALEIVTCEETERSEPSAEYTEEIETVQPETSADTAETIAETESAVIPDDIEDWRRAYVEYLNEWNVIAGGILLDDINFDGTPEAVIAVNSFGNTIVLYYNENGLQALEVNVVSVWGLVRYDPENGRIFNNRFYGHTTGTYGNEESYIYDWNGSDYVQSLSLLRESGYYFSEETVELGQAFINGEPVSNDVFDEKCDEFYGQAYQYDYFPVVKTTDENFEEYMRENFPGFNNWEAISRLGG